MNLTIYEILLPLICSDLKCQKNFRAAFVEFDEIEYL